LAPFILHPLNGFIIAYVMTWLKLVEELDGLGSRMWHLATMYFKKEGFFMFARARLLDMHH